MTVENKGSDTRYWMRQQPTEVDHRTIATVLDLNSDALNTTYPVLEVSNRTLGPHYPLTSLNAA